MPVTFKRNDNLKASTAESLIGRAIKQGFIPLGDGLIASLKARSPKDRGGFQKGHKKRIEGVGLNTTLTVFNSAPHAIFVEEGRKPGKQPPPAVVLSLVKRKGLGATPSQQKSIAFLIGRSIGRKGIKGRFLYRDLRADEASRISAAFTNIKIRIAATLNS